MQGRKGTNHSRRRVGEISVFILCTLILSTISGLTPTVKAQSPPQLIISPNIANLAVGGMFSMSVNLTDFPSLYAYQVALKFNGTILNVTSVVFNSTAGAFFGHPYAQVPEPTDMEATPDLVDGLNWIMVGSSLLGDDSVNVVNGVLCVVNFTVIGIGQTNVLIATQKAPVTINQITYFYSNCLDSNLIEHTNFDARGCTVLSGVANAPPIAFFSVTTPSVDNRTFLVLYQNIPPTASSYSVAFQGLISTFNASDSYAPTGNITAYIWDFGDGNITVVNATVPGDAVITHVYHTIGYARMSLTVVSSGDAGSALMESAPEGTLILVDLALQYYDWSWLIYTLFAIAVAFIAISVAKSAILRVRKRRALKTGKILDRDWSSPPQTGTNTT